MKNKKKTTIEKRQEKEKELVLKNLRKTPIIQIACDRAGISRATYYRWRNEDKEFKKIADGAIREGELFINDISESQIISLIKEKNWPAISFWLKHNHPKYANRIEIDANIKNADEELTAEQKAVVKEALKLASLDQQKDEKENKQNK